MCKIDFNDEEFQKMKRSNGIELLNFSIEKVLKKYGKWFFKMRGNPEQTVVCLWCLQSDPAFFFIFIFSSQ